MSRTELEAREKIGVEGDALVLVAALAAALLEYRRLRDEAVEGTVPVSGAQWRTMARLEQLQAWL